MIFQQRSLRYLRFWLRVIIWTTVAVPVMAVDPSITEPASHSEQAGQPEEQVVPPEPISAVSASSEATFSSGHYWVVSTRRSVQTIHLKHRGPWQLDVYYGSGNGQLTSSNLSTLSARLVSGIPVCIVSHGSFVSWESQTQQSCQAARRLQQAAGNRPLQLVFFTWPSDGPYTLIAPVDISVRGKRAEFNGFHMARLISQIPESCPVTILGHSHGSRVALSAMQLAAGGSVQDHFFSNSCGRNRRFRVIMAAGAVDHHWLNPGQRYGLALNRLECLLNLRNQNDLALAWYPLTRPFARRAVARSGLTGHDLQLLGWNAQKVRQVDVTNRLGSAHQWPDYYSDPQVLRSIIPYLVSF